MTKRKLSSLEKGKTYRVDNIPDEKWRLTIKDKSVELTEFPVEHPQRDTVTSRKIIVIQKGKIIIRATKHR